LGQRFYDEIERLILDLRRQPERFGLSVRLNSNGTVDRAA
jgi:hypothetical protein